MTPEIPNSRVPYHGPVVEGSQDRDNFVRNLTTILYGGWWWDSSPFVRREAVSRLSQSAASRAAVLTLAKIKVHCRIEIDQTVEDDLLLDLEMAARIHTENVLRQVIDDTVGENIKQALLVLIAHWYRNRENVGSEKLALVPMTYAALLSCERAFPRGVY